MSLLDALLLDPYRDPHSVWIAKRTDGQAGTGTIDDPLDGSSRVTSEISISSLVLGTGSPPEVIATAAQNHGFREGDMVTVFGVTGEAGIYYNGTFRIYEVGTATFKYRLINTPTAAIQGTVSCWLERERFDALMRTMPANTVIHLGPGIFETKGYDPDAAGSWAVLTAQKFRGSGIGVTILKLVNTVARHPGVAHTIMSCSYKEPADHFEATDLTFDCNLDAQRIAGVEDFAGVAVAAVFVPGRHTRLRRVRAVNWGSHVDQECFALGLGGAHPDNKELYDCVIEDCILDQPSSNCVETNTPLLSGVGGGIGTHPRACIARNNWLDAETRTNDVPIKQITFSSTTVTVQTRWPHGRQNGSWVTVSGAYVKGNPENPFNGSFLITRIDDLTFTYTIPGSPVPGPAGNPAGQMHVGRVPSNYFINTAKVDKETDGADLYAVVTTQSPHYRIPRTSGKPISYLRVRGVYYLNDSTKQEPTPFNGVFTVENVTSSTILKYKLSETPASEATGGFIGIDAHGPAGNGIGGVTEGNFVRNFSFGHYSDTNSIRHMLVMDNYYANVLIGVYHNKGESGGAVAGSLTRNGSLATFHTALSFPHNLQVGDAVLITRALRSEDGTASPLYNGYFTIESIPDPFSFSYRMTADPGENASGSPLASEFWQIGLAVVENNEIELHPLRSSGPTAGAGFGGAAHINPYVFKNLVFRENSTRISGAGTDPTYQAYGLQANSTQHAFIESNIIDVSAKPEMSQTEGDQINYFQNQTPAGEVVQGFKQLPSNQFVQVDDVTSRIDDALMLSLF